jgi:hypothetical protein
MFFVFSITIIILTAIFFLKYEGNRDIAHFKNVACRLNGEIVLKPKAAKSRWIFLRPPDIFLKVSYLHIDFTVTVYDDKSSHNTGRFFSIVAKTDFVLLPFRLAKEAGLFAQLPGSLPESSTKPAGAEAITEKTISKEIVIDNRKYILESRNVEAVTNLINQAYLQDSFIFLLEQFSGVEVVSDGARLLKRWSLSDSNPETVIKLFDYLSRICESLKA